MNNPRVDFVRYYGEYRWHFNYSEILCYLFRKRNSSIIYKLIFSFWKNLKGIELSADTQIGPGLYIGHPWGITINPQCIIGSNVNIHKGVTIGQENRGIRKGCPQIGNCVWIGVNATVVGNIVIGDDVFIAPNSFVNFNVPSHSIVIGNKILSCKNATEGYINNKVVLQLESKEN